MTSYVLYHGGCSDGFGAAFAAWMRLQHQATEYIPVSYGKPMPDIPDGSDVYIVDFSYSREMLISLSERCQVRVLDHHKTAQAGLEGLPFCTFDMDKSGAVLAWEYFHPGDDVPEILLYVQDRDLWKWKMTRSKEVNAAIASHPQDFFTWSGFIPGMLAIEGKHLSLIHI